jgi:hypothetical protein
VTNWSALDPCDPYTCWAGKSGFEYIATEVTANCAVTPSANVTLTWSPGTKDRIWKNTAGP